MTRTSEIYKFLDSEAKFHSMDTQGAIFKCQSD